MSSGSQNADTHRPTVPKGIMTQPVTGSMIDSRNVYKVSPTKPVVTVSQQQDIVKIRLTKDESGTGIGYTKSIITSTHPLEDKTDNRTTPQKLNINLAQQPTLQLKTAQNKIVLVKMLPKMPQNGPQVITAPTVRSSISPTTLALARSVQGLRPIAHVGSIPISTVASLAPTTSLPEKKEPCANQQVQKTESNSLSSLSSCSTLTTTSSSNTSTSASTETDSSNKQISSPTPSDDSNEKEQPEDLQAHSTIESENPDESSSIGTGNARMSREMRCLKASQSSSKILTEFMLDSCSSEKLRKRRRSRVEGEDSRSCGSLTPTSQKRYSMSGRDDDELDDDKGSPSSSLKRSGMRSANAEFSMKQKKFLNSILQHSDGSDNSDNEGDRHSVSKDARRGTELQIPVAPKLGWDKFCWRCKTCEPGLETCAGCIRCFHPVCLKLNPAFFIVEKKWNCPECIKAHSTNDEDSGDKPVKDSNLRIESLTVSLKFAMKRMQQLKGSSILNPLDKEQFPNYDHFVTNHIDLTTLQNNVTDQKYNSTEAFQADISWIVHNATIYPVNNKLLAIAKGLMKICKQEINEIEACNECYFNANTSKTWFTEVCSKPHLLVWAKLKGFPFWPAKLMSVNVNQLADVRFFGDHDRAWVPIKECFLFCDKDPNTKLQRRTNMAECMREAETYIAKLKKKFGNFSYAEFRTQIEPGKLDEHLEAMIPGVLKKLAENGDSQKAKLMLKIIKTADNFLSVSPISLSPPITSTPKGKQRDSVSPDKIREIFGSPKDKSTEESPKIRLESIQIKDEIRNSISTPDPVANPTRIYATRKRKSSISDDVKSKEAIPDALREPSKRISRLRTSTASKVKDDDTSSNASEPVHPAGLRCYISKKRKPSSPAPHMVKEPKQNKIESVVLQRESDSWKTVPAGKKSKSASKSSESESEKIETVQESTVKNQVPATETTSALATKSDQEVPKQPTAAATEDIVQEKEVGSKADDGRQGETSGTNKFNILPLIPLAADEIKTEPTEEEPPPALASVTKESSAGPSADLNTSNNSVAIDSTLSSTSLPLLPIKSEPVSDDESPSTNTQLIVSNTPQSSNQPTESENQVVIRTSNRIMVKDINKLTSNVATRASTVLNNNGQPVVLTPVDKAKVTQMFMPKPPVVIQAKARKPGPNQSAAIQNVPTLKRSIAVAGGGLPGSLPGLGSNNFQAGRSTGNMMHMVHIPSPLPMANDQAGRIAQSNGTVPPQPRQQQPSATATSSNESPMSPTVNNPTQQATTSGQANAGNATASAPGSSSDATRSVEGEHMMSGFITPSLAAAVTETIVSTPPKLQSRPSGTLRSEGDCVYPSGAGPVSQILINNSYKMADFFRSVIEDTLADLSNNSGALEAKVKVLELEIEKLKHCHQQEITKLKHNSDMVLCEMRKNMELEKTRIINEVRKQCEIERIRSVEEAKKKQWCVNCGKEALFYCCWNTSYCDYPCQQQHWATHMNHCTQSQFNLPSNALASKPSTVINSKLTAQHITTPKITTVQTLNLNGRSGLTIQPTSQVQQQQQQQQLIITSTRGGAQLGKGQPFQRLMLNPVSGGPPSYTIVSNAPSKWPHQPNALTATINSVEQKVVTCSAVTPTPVGLLASSSVVAAAVSGGVLGRPSSAKSVASEKFVIGAK
ncbi:MYND-type zinc finger-containing chromatin reader ZMYND8 isoform X2 [Ochlerotatus camptorhynchus]|uniref:MYND-type zinc finger-containing chromatin reader ZMYND8 isoform X2 n=1 Tax=Ochlerotatus camptorhynchus TaxID=644619 RepID=UPI0031E32323